MMAFSETHVRRAAAARKAQLALAIRVTVAAAAAYAIATALHLMLPLWAVLTSLIVTQMSVGRSLKATRDYMLGTDRWRDLWRRHRGADPAFRRGGLAGAAGAGGHAAGFHRGHQSQPERRHRHRRDRAAGSDHAAMPIRWIPRSIALCEVTVGAFTGLAGLLPGAAVAGASARSASTRRGCWN